MAFDTDHPLSPAELAILQRMGVGEFSAAVKRRAAAITWPKVKTAPLPQGSRRRERDAVAHLDAWAQQRRASRQPKNAAAGRAA
jgi:hypothetical protein